VARLTFNISAPKRLQSGQASGGNFSQRRHFYFFELGSFFSRIDWIIDGFAIMSFGQEPSAGNADREAMIARYKQRRASMTVPL
jgi:hypothetical protein